MWAAADGATLTSDVAKETSVEITDVTDPVPRRVIESFDRQEEADALVAQLAQGGLAMSHFMIVGRDLELVEDLGERLSPSRLALAGAVFGMVVGVLSGLFLGLWFAPEGLLSREVILAAAGVGALFSGALALFLWAVLAARGLSTGAIKAGRYEVLVDESVADAALCRLHTSTRPAPARAWAT